MIYPTNTVCPEWQNENVLRAYPLEDDAPASSVIPTWIISDLRITADAVYDFLFISNVYVSQHIVSVGISGISGTSRPVGLLTKTVTIDELEPFRTYSMDRLTATANGTIAFGDPGYPVTPFKLSPYKDESRIVSSAVVRTKMPGVTRIIDKQHGVAVAGIVDLSGNSEFRTYLSKDNSGDVVVVELTDMYKELTTSICSRTPDFSACGETPVRTINGVPPADDGTFTLKFM